MKLLDKKTSGDLVRLMIFIVVTSLASSVLIVLIGNLTFKGSEDYQAVFADVTGVYQGDDVRIAGVRVGTVKGIEIVDAEMQDGTEAPARAKVTFTVEKGVSLVESTHATIRYRNLVGQRYLSLTEVIGDSGTLEPGSTIPVVADDSRPRPDPAVQRVQAVVQGAVARRHQQALLRDHPGLPG